MGSGRLRVLPASPRSTVPASSGRRLIPPVAIRHRSTGYRGAAVPAALHVPARLQKFAFSIMHTGQRASARGNMNIPGEGQDIESVCRLGPSGLPSEPWEALAHNWQCVAGFSTCSDSWLRNSWGRYTLPATL